MTNANDTAYPANSREQTDGGLTKREYLAAMAMNGLLSYYGNSSERAKQSTELADQLISQLNKEK